MSFVRIEPKNIPFVPIYLPFDHPRTIDRRIFVAEKSLKY